MYKNTPGPEGPRGVEKGLGRKRPKQKALPAGRSLPQAGPKGGSAHGDHKGAQGQKQDAQQGGKHHAVGGKLRIMANFALCL